jgi:OmpR family response regulator RpaB
MPTILLIDDDERLAGPLREYFARFNLNLINEVHPDAGLARLTRDNIDLVILDVMLPGMDGFEVCRTIRKNNTIPIVMLTARGDVMDRVVGLELGADDYLPKPFEPRELVARVQNVLKRTGTSLRQPGNQLHFGELEIDLESQQVCVSDNIVHLTTMEYQLLALLSKSPGKNYSRDEILNELKGIDADIYTRSVDILVSRLRQKLRPTEFIKTVWGSGYSFVGSQR